MSILPVDQGIEHSAGASFAPNPIYFDPENIVKLAIEGGCNAVASTLGVLGSVLAEVRPQDPVHRQDQSQRAADLSEQVRPDHVRLVQQAYDMGAVAVGATIYFGSDELQPPDPGSRRSVPHGPRTGHGHRAVVLPPEQRLQEGRG
jgi:class I fructose-bisphosphate aldolase